MTTLRLLFRWSWRDLRSHWAKVLAIALVIAIGTGGYAGLTSTAEWRRVSYDLNYRELAMYDLRVDLATGSFVSEGEIAALVSTVPSAASITGVEERLIVPTQVDASTGDEIVLARGEITSREFVGFILFSVFVGASLGSFPEIVSQVQRANGATERLREILAEEPEEMAEGGEAGELRGGVEARATRAGAAPIEAPLAEGWTDLRVTLPPEATCRLEGS